MRVWRRGNRTRQGSGFYRPEDTLAVHTRRYLLGEACGRGQRPIHHPIARIWAPPRPTQSPIWRLTFSLPNWSSGMRQKSSRYRVVMPKRTSPADLARRDEMCCETPAGDIAPSMPWGCPGRWRGRATNSLRQLAPDSRSGRSASGLSLFCLKMFRVSEVVDQRTSQCRHHHGGIGSRIGLTPRPKSQKKQILPLVKPWTLWTGYAGAGPKHHRVGKEGLASVTSFQRIGI